MSHKRILLTLLVVSLLLVLTGYFVIYPEKIGLCNHQDDACIFGYPVFSLGKPLFFGMPFVSTVLLLLIFMRVEIYKAWRKFAIFGLPIVIILTALIPVRCESGLGPLGPCLTREVGAVTLGIIFLAISLLIIGIKSLKLRKTQG